MSIVHSEETIKERIVAAKKFAVGLQKLFDEFNSGYNGGVLQRFMLELSIAERGISHNGGILVDDDRTNISMFTVVKEGYISLQD